MVDLKIVVTTLEIIIGVGVAVVVGDWAGYKFGHMRVATYALFAFLALVILFAIYAAIYLGTH